MKTNRNSVVADIAANAREALRLAEPENVAELNRDFVVAQVQEAMATADSGIQKWLDGVKAASTRSALENDIVRAIEPEFGLQAGHWGRRRSQIKVRPKYTAADFVIKVQTMAPVKATVGEGVPLVSKPGVKGQVPLTELSRPEVHDLMLDADGQRARIAKQGLIELEDKLDAQGIKGHHKRFVQRTDKLVAKNKATDEYKAANDLFNACSNRLREFDGDSQLRDRDGKVITLPGF
jgi:hypothetical protein